ncbi:hypothetical protein HPS57_00870 [Prevotella sp. PINT]|jgi:hypothetical protein|uniref:hypothetical protein n=1 Tax=Palleniella intestinalis TaxID=2736291 RepID=UPI001552DFBB|nr:hypothetical protein [Palleniella intestinalis]NPD80536.1 hypothetical protein [Palleniella intestinalis]
MTLHIFNPEHDIALAADSPFWTSPKAGIMLRRSLGWLPALWAKDGDIVVVSDVSEAHSEQEAVESILRRRCIEIHFCTLNDVIKKTFRNNIDNVDVWGWDSAIVNQLARAGVPRGLMPSDEVLKHQRALSDRATSAKLLDHLVHLSDIFCGEAIAVHNINNIEILAENWGSIVLKSPWSSSGRGVRQWMDGNQATRRWAEKVIESQGHIMVERYLDKVMDFAMEFNVDDDGTVKYQGLSLFSTSGSAYTGNMLAPEEDKRKILSAYIAAELLDDIACEVCQWMQHALSGYYIGPFGIDMMIVRINSGNGFGINPCVEINLRRTMGHVALCISDTEGARGKTMNVVFRNNKHSFCIE